MTKKKQSGDTSSDPTSGDGGGQEKPKRQRANASIWTLFAPFTSELAAYAEEKYRAVRFDTNATDEQLAARDQLRKAIAQLGGQ